MGKNVEFFSVDSVGAYYYTGYKASLDVIKEEFFLMKMKRNILVGVGLSCLMLLSSVTAAFADNVNQIMGDGNTVIFIDVPGNYWAKDQIDFFEVLPEYDTAMYCHKKMKTNEEKSLEVLKEVLPLLEAQEDFSNDALFELLKGYVEKKGVKVGFVMWPLRTAVSGKQSTPGGATELMEIFGKEESLARIRKGIELLS